MKRIIALIAVLLLCLPAAGCKKGPQRYTKYSFDYFDTVTTVIGYAESEEAFDAVYQEIKSQLEEYHRLYDIYTRYEGLNNLCTVNETVGGVHAMVKVDQKILDLLIYAKEMYTLTAGKVNVAMGSVLSIWHEYRNTGISNPAAAAVPPMEKLQEAAKHTDIQKVILDEEASTVFLADPAMKLDVGAVAKGYAAEMVADTLEQKEITGYLLNLGGNLRAVGKRADGKPWVAGIENPDTADEQNPYVATLSLEGQALVTSGSYQRYYTVEGKRYHHIIHDKTLMPENDYLSVSVLCDHSGLGDALSTALFNMEYQEGSALVASMNGVEALWVLPNGTKQYSAGFPQ